MLTSVQMILGVSICLYISVYLCVSLCRSLLLWHGCTCLPACLPGLGACHHHLLPPPTELLKNSMRATVEHHGVDNAMPPIKVIIADGEDNEDVVSGGTRRRGRGSGVGQSVRQAGSEAVRQ